MPTWSAPRLAPPERTNAVRGLKPPPVASLCRGCSATVVTDTPRRPAARRARSWRVPERVTKRVGRVGGRNPERDQSVGAYVVEDDLGLPGVAIPLERHGETVAASCVELNEHRATRGRPTLRPGGNAAPRRLRRSI